MSVDNQETILQLKETLERLAFQTQLFDLNNKGRVNDRKREDKKLEAKDYFESLSKEYIDFTYENPTIYHVVETFAKLLDENGFTYLSEKTNWAEIKHGKYYTIRNGTNLCAFTLGSRWNAESGIGVIGGHIDALSAKLKPASKKPPVEGFELLGVAPYGDTLNELWLDRDLGIGGRVLVKDYGTGKVESRLLNSAPHPIARIPSLAPHFGAPSVGPFDKEDQTVPVIGFLGNGDYTDDGYDLEDEKKSPLYGKHSIHVLRYVAEILSVKVSQLLQFDLELFDVQKGTFSGLKKDFISLPRVDDRICSFSAIKSLIQYANEGPIPEGSFNIAILYDNEEVGSLSRQGAKGGLMESVVERVVANLYPDDVSRTRSVFANSFIISADVTHMLNPNFKNVYLENHMPKPNVGITLALDSNGHMATDVVGTALVEEIARLNGDKIQYFQIKNNSRSGGTIGPSVASQTGARTVDMGISQWSMHSIRASTGSKDVGLAVKFFKGFYNNWRNVYDQFGDL